MRRRSNTGALGRWLGLRVARRVGRSVPLVGVAVSAALVGEAIRRKGWIGGLLDTGLNALPVVGAVKSGLELVRARDFFPNRR